ncbi:zinc finger protein ZFAT-like isoform X2 [Centruroides vittatus]|uniref:zinc finger protein ZFAT-like isoform X2 n=1 Tax=Centruroides vittatus TaxID=120091 RepID=UPI00351065C2
MDVLICGICHEEFNDIVKFMDHKKLGLYHNSDCGKIIESTEDVNEQENNICILKSNDNMDENNIMEIYANEVSSIEQNDNAQVENITLDDLGNVTMIPDQDGNIALMGNIQIVHSTDGDPAVVTVASDVTTGSEVTTENAIFTLQTPDNENQTEQNTEFVSLTSESECNVAYTENRITSSNFSFQLKGQQLEGIFACNLCQCFALTQNEIISHIQVIHKDHIIEENKNFEQLYVRLEPLKEPKNQIIQENFSNQLSNSLKVYPISTNAEQEKSDAIHLVVETIREQDTIVPLPSQGNQNAGQVKKRRGRPRKTENQKKCATEEQETSKTEETQPLPEIGSDGQYHCPRCKRAFKKERHILGHKCLGKGDYIDISIKENSVSEEVMEEEPEVKEETEDDEKEVDTDCTEDFKMYMSIDRPPWSRGRRGNNRGRFRGRGRGRGIYRNMEEKQNDVTEFQTENNDGNKENQALISIVIEDIENEVKENDDDSSGPKAKLNWRNDPHHIPVFNTEDERLAFEERLNAVDLSCVDHLYVWHEVTQDVDMSKMGKMTGRETNELLVFSCNICKKVFKSLSHMRLHCIIHTDLKPFECPQCPFRSNAKGNLYTHMRKHTGNYFKCSQCNFQSLNRSHLAEHEATHSNRRHQCKLCHNYYNTVKSLMNHVRKYHTNSHGRQYLSTFLVKPQNLMALLHICHICNRKFKKKIDRDRHLFIHNIRDSPNIFHCNLCDYTACRRSYLENHHRRHRLVFVCCLCKSMFISTIVLKNHLQDHVNKKSVNLQSTNESSENIEDCNLATNNDQPLCDDKISDNETQSIENKIQIESFSPLKTVSKDNNMDLLKNELHCFPKDCTIDSLFKDSLNNSWYLPEPDGTVALSQYINLPEELRENQDQNESSVENINNQSSSVDETSQSTLTNYSPIVSLNYKSLTVELYKKIQETFGTVECEYCGRLFHTYIDLEPHLMTHSENKPYKCDKCPYTAASKENLKRHQESIHEGRKFSCDKCDFVASSRTTYWHHRQKHLITAQCNICNKQFPTTRILKNHVLCKHPEIDQTELQKLLGNNHRVIGRIGRCSYKCPYCSRVFHRSSADLQKHIWIHEGIKPFKCSECSHTCRSRNNLKIHMLRHSNDKPHLCEECGKSYKSKTALRCHVKSHFVDGMFQCDQCDYTVNQKSHLKKHMESHQLSRRYVCEHCDYSSNGAGYMRVHYNRKHKGETFIEKPDSSVSITVESSEQVYKCLSCKSVFENMIQTKQHLKDKHGISADKLDSTLQESAIDSAGGIITDENTRFETDTVMMDNIQEPIEMIELQDNNIANSVISTTLQGVQLANLTEGEMDEKTVSAVNLIQQIIEQGALESQVTLHSVDGQSLVAVNPGTIIVQDGQELVLNGTNLDEQYVIQYVTDSATTSTDAEIHIQSCEEVQMYKDFDNQIEVQYSNTEEEQNIIEQGNT